jgi:hypothetical protein
MFIGAAVINPMYTGRSSRLIRKIVVGISGLYFFIMVHNYKESWKYNYYVKFWDYYPPHVREYLKSLDSRYLLLFDVHNSPYKLFDETSKKSLF